MTVIRMLTHMTTGRYDGRQWPPYLGEIDVPEWEAEHLVNGGNAEYPDSALLDRGYDVLKEAAVDYESHLKPVGGEYPDEDPRYARHPEKPEEPEDDFDSDFERDDFDREPEVKRPYANASKADWVDYVVEKGLAKRSAAKDMTKAQLMELDS